MLRIGSLFSGIGGLELGLERAGLGRVVWQCEIDPFCRQVLAKRWPEVARYEDVTKVGSDQLEPVDALCGGFPCQDVSSAGKGAGLSGARSGLWYEYLRVVADLRPRLVIVENVSSGKRRWLPFVRADLEALGYETVALELGACDVGAPHKRLRVFVVAYANDKGESALAQYGEVGRASSLAGVATHAAQSFTNANANGRPGQGLSNGQRSRCLAPKLGEVGSGRAADSHRADPDFWTVTAMPQPALRRVDDGLPARVDRNRRLKALGNAVVPQCAEAVGRWILQEVVCWM